MRIVFCLSYVTVPVAMTLAIGSDESLVLTSHGGLHRFFTEALGRGRSYLLPSPQGIFSIPVLKSFHAIACMVRLRRRFLHYANEEVFYAFVAFCSLEAWLVRLLSARNAVYRVPLLSVDHIRPRRTLRFILHAWHTHLLYRVPIVPSWNGFSYVPMLHPRFHRQVGALNHGCTPDHKSIQQLVQSKYNIADAHILLLSGGVVEDGFVSKDEYSSKMDILLSVIDREFGRDATRLKLHPRYSVKHSKENFLSEIAAYVPANVLLGCFDVCIGYNTSTLFEAANGGKTAISLLKYFTPANEEARGRFVKYLELNATGILHFPQTIEEMEELLRAGRSLALGPK